LTDHPERFQSGQVVYISGARYELEQLWYHKGQPIFKFRGVDSIGDAEKLAGQEVCVPVSERFELPEGEYYYSDLIGCRMVECGSGEMVGTVTGWQECGGAPVLLEVNGGDILVPFAAAILKNIDLAARRIEVDLPEGLKDLNSGSRV
jgi:16S rRNA processing protein RimM